MEYKHKMNGTCAREVSFEIDDGKIKNVRFENGCSGNGLGIAALAEGRSAAEIVGLLTGITCGFKQTSCPAELAKAIKYALSEESR